MAIQSLVIILVILLLLLALGVPIAYSIGISALVAILQTVPLDVSVVTAAQRTFVGMSKFSLTAIPFFILAGNLMNQGGIAKRLVDFVMAILGKLPGALLVTNAGANALFGAISGSASAAAAAVGSMVKEGEEEQGYDPALCAATNGASAPSGLLIPPSNALITYSLASGGTSVAALFLGGYIPGILWALCCIIVGILLAKRKGYHGEPGGKPPFPGKHVPACGKHPTIFDYAYPNGNHLHGLVQRYPGWSTGSGCGCCGIPGRYQPDCRYYHSNYRGAGGGWYCKYNLLHSWNCGILDAGAMGYCDRRCDCGGSGAGCGNRISDRTGQRAAKHENAGSPGLQWSGPGGWPTLWRSISSERRTISGPYGSVRWRHSFQPPEPCGPCPGDGNAHSPVPCNLRPCGGNASGAEPGSNRHGGHGALCGLLQPAPGQLWRKRERQRAANAHYCPAQYTYPF